MDNFQCQLSLGYACINTVLQEQNIKKDRISVNKSCVAKTFKEKGKNYAIELAKNNLKSVCKILEWNERHGIYLYRLSSDMFPHITNSEFIEDGNKYAYSLDNFATEFKNINDCAKKYKQRLTFHPGQFNQVGAKDRNVFEKTVRDLSFHADVLDYIGCDKNSVMVVHGGGTYGNKQETMERWISQFYEMPGNVRNRLVIENCERQYNPMDMLYLSSKIDRPVVFDTHHHDCFSKVVENLPDPSTFIDQIVKTWTKHSITPKFHISEQAPDKRIGAHSDYVEKIPDYLLSLVDSGRKIDLMIEAKAKEQAVLYLYDKYSTLDYKNKIWKRKI